MVLRKFADMQHKNSSKSKVSLLKLIKSDYLFNLGINSCKTCLRKKTLLTNLSIVSGVQDAHQEAQSVFNVFPNWTSQRRSNLNMIL